METIQLFERPHAEAKRLLEAGAPVWVTVNPVEYHGPHLSLHNDRLISQGLCSDLHARLYPRLPMLVAADLEVGVEPCRGKGTRHTRFAVVKELVLETCRALAELGARRVVLMTFHGAPLHNLAIEAGAEWLRGRGIAAVAPFHVVLRELMMLEAGDPRFEEVVAGVEDAHDRAALMAGLPRDFHAGFFETSVALHYAPDSVGERKGLADCPEIRPVEGYAKAAAIARRLGREVLARELELAAVGIGWGMLKPFPGYTGKPRLASAECGKVFARLMVERFGACVEGVFERGEAPPEPIMRWVEKVTMGGRLGPTGRPAA